MAVVAAGVRAGSADLDGLHRGAVDGARGLLFLLGVATPLPDDQMTALPQQGEASSASVEAGPPPAP